MEEAAGIRIGELSYRAFRRRAHLVADRHRDHPATTMAGLEADTLLDKPFHLATGVLVAAGLAVMLLVRRRGECAALEAPPRP